MEVIDQSKKGGSLLGATERGISADTSRSIFPQKETSPHHQQT